MYEDPCPNCGHRRKRMVMSTDPSKPGLIGLWKGEGNDPFMRLIAKTGTLLLGSLFLGEALHLLGI